MPSLIAPAVTGWLGLTGATFLGISAVAFVEVGLGLLATTILSRGNRQGATAQQGIATKFTGQGDTTPQSIIVGRYATAGHQVVPVYSHTSLASEDGTGGFGSVGWGKYSTFVISLSDAPVTGLDGLYVDGTYFSVATHLAGDVHGYYGMSVASGEDRDKYEGKLWVKFYDGTQTAADPYLRGAYGSHPTRSWKSTSVLKGAAYMIVTVKNDTELYSGGTKFRAVVRGVPLLDPRTATTAYTDNAAVIQYNIANGITMPDGRVFGLSGVDLPSDYWDAAMDVCDLQVAKQGGGTETQYRAGYEIFLATPDDGGADPLSALDTLLLASSGQVADIGGTLITRSGGPATSVLSITDDDILNSREQSYQPFYGLRDTFNAVSVTYVDPEAKWEAVEAPFYVDSDGVAEDGEQLIANLTLNAVPYADQVQRERIAWLADARRGRSHIIVLPARLDRVSIFDVISVTSNVHGYSNKLFEIVRYRPDFQTGAFQITIREVDPSDFTPDASKYIAQAFPSDGRFIPTISLSSFSVAATAGTDSTGVERYPSLAVSWAGEGLDLLRWIAFTVTNSDGHVVASVAALDAESGQLTVTDGIISGESYTVAAALVADLPTSNPPAQTVTSKTVLLSPSDFDPSVADYVQDISSRSLTVIEAENINIIEQDDQHPDWLGTVESDGVVSSDIQNGDLYLVPSIAGQAVTYRDDTPFDLIDVFQVRIKAGAGVEFWNADYTWDTWGTWDSVARWAGSTAGCAAQTQVRTTLDDPADPLAVWTAWAVPSTLLVKARGVQTRIVLTFGATNHRARITYATTIIDVPDRTASERGVAVPDTGLDYVFAPAFRDIPVVVVTHVSPADGERFILSGEAADGCRIDIVDASGAGVAGTINIYAKGYGRRETI
jgi:hypothetical protein